jgi:autophagy-related protein 11
LGADLELIRQVQVHVEFLSNAVRKAIEAGGEGRTLADYVSSAKMTQVAEACRRTHGTSQPNLGSNILIDLPLEDLRAKFEQVELAVSRVKEGADIIRSALNEIKLIQDADSTVRRSQEIVDKIAECAATLESPASSPDAIIQELRRLDVAHRDEIQAIADIKVSLFCSQG